MKRALRWLLADEQDLAVVIAVPIGFLILFVLLSLVNFNERLNYLLLIPIVVIIVAVFKLLALIIRKFLGSLNKQLGILSNIISIIIVVIMGYFLPC